jgi:anti-anti-sigma regulatory factor
MKDYKLATKKNKKGDEVTITMEGQLGIANMVEIKKQLLTKTKGAKKIKLELTQVDDADLTLIQTFVAFKQKCENEKTELSVNMNIKEDILLLFNRAGFNNIF